MDDLRFDQIARGIGSGISRRRLLRLLGGALATTTLHRQTTLAVTCAADIDCGEGAVCCLDLNCGAGECCPADGEPNQRCPEGYDCVGGFCSEPAGCVDDTGCPGGICCAGACLASIVCCPGDPSRCPEGYVCTGGFCSPPPCGSDADCGPGICCDGTCAFQECCPGDLDGRCPPNQECVQGFCATSSCDNDLECQSGVCCAGFCTPGLAEFECCGSDTNPDDRCPDGYGCFAGTCEPVVPDPPGEGCCAAIELGSACAPNACCTLISAPDSNCPAGSSCSGSGGDGVCCVVNDQPCLDDTPCCGGLTCAAGVCNDEPVDETPTPTPGEPKWNLWTAGALHGAAIYVRRRTPDDDPQEFGSGLVGPVYEQADFDRLADLGVDFVEISHPAPFAEQAPYSRDDDLQQHLDDLIDMAENAHLFVVLSLRTGPAHPESAVANMPICQAGGCFSESHVDPFGVTGPSDLWTDPAARDAWRSIWRSMAQRYADKDALIGYHILPMPGTSTTDYPQLLSAIAASVRQSDSHTPILVSAPGDGLPNDMSLLEPIEDDRTVYLVNTYSPARYLQQGIEGEKLLAYGDPFDQSLDPEVGEFDRTWLEQMLQPALDWGADLELPVAIGGFGMARWQPGLANYYSDLLELFTSENLSSTFWFWYPANSPEQSNGFNVELGPDPASSEIVKNELVDVLEQYWVQNHSEPDAELKS